MEPEADGPFPIVGIGASAGGLEALEEFFRHVPEGCGMAFVVVQHLDPTHVGVLAELLQRTTSMPVVQVRDRMKVKPDSVYVIPPNRDLSLLHGSLHLLEPTAPRGLRLPIDFFFRSLADDRHERSIGVVLSGMGSDGTPGLRAIKEAAGLVLVQEPATAKFDAMPRSAIAAGLADVVAPAAELPERIASYVKHASLLGRTAPLLPEGERSALEKVAIVLRARTGHDFSLYKKSTVQRRIERRMGIHQIDRIATYVQYLQKNPQEVDLLFRELLIGVTSFFRDPDAWDQLRDEALPPLLASRPPRSVLRAWSVGCSTGEEAFSLAIAFREAVEKTAPHSSLTLQVFATDLDPDAIARGRQGHFPPGIVADVSPERMKRFFVQEEDGSFRIGKEIREMVTFATQNAIMDPPFTKLDVLVCRNLLIYLGPELQKRLLPLFHYSLNAGGTLFLGSAETAGGEPDLFTPLPGKSRLYRRGSAAVPLEAIPFPAVSSAAGPPTLVPSAAQKAVPDIQALADHVLLQRFAPAAVLVNRTGDILFVSGRTGKYLEPAAGKANWNVFAMAREGLRLELPEAFRKAVREGGVGHLRGLRMGGAENGLLVDVTVQALAEPEALRGTVMIVFSDAAAPPAAPQRPQARRSGLPGRQEAALQVELDEARSALQSLRSDVQAMREEMQSSTEELKSANEELQSTNEELQSTNEELTTSREEMQSLNEELQTVNAEQVARMDELTRASDDMKNLLNATDIATVFLDGDLRVRRFTTGATRLFKLIPGDVGRPLTDVSNSLQYPDLVTDAREVLRTLVFSQKEIATEGERWFEVRILPYRTVDNRIDGVVMTFFDITRSKTLEARLRLAAPEEEPGPVRRPAAGAP
ncbi:MAG: PAS domain-containing protein [Holophagales bacterium]|nr:PAS domain-containing protein [Holophagales bacterium]